VIVGIAEWAEQFSDANAAGFLDGRVNAQAAFV
jgi:hypothetical protein